MEKESSRKNNDAASRNKKTVIIGQTFNLASHLGLHSLRSLPRLLKQKCEERWGTGCDKKGPQKKRDNND